MGRQNVRGLPVICSPSLGDTCWFWGSQALSQDAAAMQEDPRLPPKAQIPGTPCQRVPHSCALGQPAGMLDPGLADSGRAPPAEEVQDSCAGVPGV